MDLPRLNPEVHHRPITKITIPLTHLQGDCFYALMRGVCLLAEAQVGVHLRGTPYGLHFGSDWIFRLTHN